MPDERKLKLGDSFEIDGEVWIWDHIVPGLEVKLRSESTPDRQLIMSVDEFLSHAGTAHRDSAISLRPDGDAWPSDVCDMETHLLEAFTGAPMNPLATAPRPQYDPALTTQAQRVDAKLLELKGTSLGRARSSFHLLWKSRGVASAGTRGRRGSRPGPVNHMPAAPNVGTRATHPLDQARAARTAREYAPRRTAPPKSTVCHGG